MTKPSRSEQMRPVELLVMSAVLALFVGVTVLISTQQNWNLALIFSGVAFIAGLMVLSLLLLAIAPKRNKKDQK